MIFPDYHLHSTFSSDSSADMNDIIKSAQDKGMNSICITDHYDMDFPVRPEEPEMDFDLDIYNYYKFMTDYKNRYSNDFNLKIGVELGIMESTVNKLHTFVCSHPELDFIIASSHLVDGLDPYYPEFFSDKTDREGYRRYFETILYNVKNFKDYNVYGHLDYIIRYGKTKDKSFDIHEHSDLFKEIFKIIVADGKGIEINTGSLYKGISFPHPHPDILTLYKEAGGEIITVGSDAHKPEYIGYGFDIAKTALLNAGFKYYCTFTNQKPEFIKIPE